MTSLRQIYISVSLVLGILILGLVGFTSWYTVDESEQAVILTFGKAEPPITEPGLKFKFPWPIQQVEVLPKGTFSLQFGYTEENGEVVSTNEHDSKMITGDENIVLADMAVQWRITDPAKYLFSADKPDEILYNATSAALRSVIGSSKIDEALTDGRAEIEAEVYELLSTLVARYDIGISVLNVKLQDVELPNAEVRAAFTNVTDARETMNTKINEAQRYQNQKLEEAKGEKEAIISRAQGDKMARIEKARGDVAVFNELYTQYKNSPDVTRERLIIETLEQVLPNAQLYILNDDGSTLTYLPLPTLNQTTTSNTSKTSKSTTEEGSGNNE